MESVKNAAQTVVETVTGPTTIPREPEDWLKASEVEVINPNEDEIMSVDGSIVTQPE